MANDKVKLEGQRKAVREHIEKYNSYLDSRDKKFAMKTIRNVQEHIMRIKQKHPHWEYSYEDDWKP